MASSNKLGLFFVLVLLVLLAIFLVIFINGLSRDKEQNDGKELNVIDVEPEFSFLTGNANNVFCQFNSGVDTDSDGIDDLCDNCPEYYNPEQEDDDYDGIGNACEFFSSENEDEDNRSEDECDSDSDCGEDRFIGNLYCSNRTVVGRYLSYTCENPESDNSECSSDTEVRVKEECADFCVDGECGSSICHNDSECDDNNYLTLDRCINAGMQNASCENTLIECASDSDCSDGGFLEDFFCTYDVIFRNFREGICIAPGMLNADCGFNIVPVFFDECDYACSDGSCVRCDENSDCNDGNSLTDDICMLPDTILSYCINNFTGECMPGQTRQCGTNVGACEFGTETCQANAHWGSCIGAINPTAETCNSIDDDCDGQVDEGGVCPPVCTNECSVNGTTECVGPTGFRICGNFDSDSCFEWSAPNQCGFGYTCQNGACVPVPPPACTNDCSIVGQTECVGTNGFRICGYFDSDSCLDWSSANQCGFGYICQNGGCVATP